MNAWNIFLPQREVGVDSKGRGLVNGLLLLITALIWGVAFVAQSVGMEYVGPWTFVFARFILAAIVLLPVTVAIDRRNRTLPGGSKAPAKRYFFAGTCCGLLLGLANIAQQVGIQYTTVGKAGFITALYVVLVPLLGLFLGKRPGLKIWFCVGLGILGLYLISIKEGFHVDRGDALVMLCALVLAAHILSVDYFSPKLENVVKLSNIQFVAASLVGLVGMVIFERPTVAAVRGALWPILYAGILSSAVGYTLQILGQKNTDPALASLILSLESVFSALAGWMLLGQVLSARELLGCVFVFLAVVFAEIPLHLERRKRETPLSHTLGLK